MSKAWLAFFILSYSVFCTFTHALPTQKPEQVCATCHQSQVADWQTSHHFHAMEVANDSSILGNFDNASLAYQNQTARFFKKDSGFYIEMPNLTGELTTYAVAYTFGYHPLQQYMFDFGNGHYQFFPFAWDSRNKQQGGQRWFVLHPEQTKTDAFHWSQKGQNWNHMCADCHSTDFQKNFDFKSNTFNSTFSAINVSCNACHGDSEQHLKWASGNNKIKNKGFTHAIGQKTPLFQSQADGTMKSVSPLKESKQVTMCATCHGRRSNLADRQGPHDFFNAFQPALLTPELYQVDGQVWDENYVWGSFVQSKMYQAGVTCANCHNPHSGKLKLQGNLTCTQCHANTTFDTPKHHGHTTNEIGSQCVDCHMPTTTYMQVDARRDHSFKVPRPDLTIKTGVSNACNQCHQDQTASWAVSQIKTWHPNSKHIGKAHFATSFHRADERAPNAAELLTRIAQDKQYSTIVSASALARMRNTPGNNALVAIARAIKDPSPLKHIAAINAATPYPVTDRWRLFNVLLDSTHHSVRIEAARSLAGMLNAPFPNELSKQDKTRLHAALNDYKKSQEFNAERGFSHTNLALLALEMAEPKAAEMHYVDAIKIEPIFMPAYVNLADLYRQQGDESKAQNILKQALSVNHEASDVYYALAMSQIRSSKKQNALKSLENATLFAPENASYLYTYALLLQDQKNIHQAIRYFEKAYAITPTNPDISYSLTQSYIALNQFKQALFYAENLARLLPNDRQIAQMVNQLRMMQGVN
ncbi:tetratricopeptide repeat protein [Pseudoalteromonas sp. XMcav1-K]|uniref:tetratricopeptide repeat protein n=1 Tax=Pseudoalteromonas sp. XMcav1-K TaxID=3374372 RepID=UPI003757AE6B